MDRVGVWPLGTAEELEHGGLLLFTRLSADLGWDRFFEMLEAKVSKSVADVFPSVESNAKLSSPDSVLPGLLPLVVLLSSLVVIIPTIVRRILASRKTISLSSDVTAAERKNQEEKPSLRRIEDHILLESVRTSIEDSVQTGTLDEREKTPVEGLGDWVGVVGSAGYVIVEVAFMITTKDEKRWERLALFVSQSRSLAYVSHVIRRHLNPDLHAGVGVDGSADCQIYAHNPTRATSASGLGTLALPAGSIHDLPISAAASWMELSRSLRAPASSEPSPPSSRRQSGFLV